MQEGQSLETHVSDKSILQHITELAEEEQRWCNDTQCLSDHTERMRHIEQELDPCWDLLRQRCTRREFDDDPDTARPWDADMVDKHLQ